MSESTPSVLYIVNVGRLMRGSGDALFALITDQGEVLNKHICSHEMFARGDLHDRRPEVVAEFQRRFGTYHLRHLGEDKMTREELDRRNAAWIAPMVEKLERLRPLMMRDEIRAILGSDD